jgi:uncharacterized protein (TIGR03435 family)
MIPWLNNCSAVWFHWMTAMLWQSAIVIAIVWAADLLLRRFAWPQFRYVLWLLIFVKLLLPPGFALPTSITSGLSVAQQFIHGDIAKPDILSSNGLAVQTPTEIAQAKMTPSTSSTIAPSMSWQSQLMLIWLAGIMVFAFGLNLRLRHLRLNRSQSDLPEWFPSLLKECADTLSIKRVPSIAITSSLKCPAVFGIFRPTILIPHEGIAWLEKKQACNILLHELTHIKRGDLFLHAIQIALQILYWPNALLWLIRRPMHDLRELCCDATVASVLRDNTPSYRQTLLEAARRLIAEPANLGLGLLGLFEQPHTIVARLKYLEKPLGKQVLCKYVSVLAALAAFIFVLPMSSMPAQTGNVQKPSPYIAKPGNSSGDQEKPRFEVVSIKRLAKEGHLSGASFKPGGIFKAVNMNLRGLIARYYGMPYMQVVDVPKLIDEASWDIEARPEEGKYPLKNNILDPDLAKLMVQSMLEDRFKLRVHQETRILPGYELRIAKGGLKLTPPKDRDPKAPPPKPTPGVSISRTKDPAMPGGVAVMPGSIWVANMPLSAYAARVLTSTLSLSGEKNRFYVVDKTGLEGNYDIQLTWKQGGGPWISSQNQAAVDDEISIFDALQDQLGLKLVPANVTVPVIVVDDAQIPVTN